MPQGLKILQANQHCDIYNENRERPHIQLKMGARPGTIEAKINQDRLTTYKIKKT